MIWSLAAPSTERLAARCEQQSRLGVTYAERGASLASLPTGYHHVRRVLAAGAGHRAFDHGKEAIREWRAQRSLGMSLSPAVPPLQPGSTMVFSLQVQWPLPLWVSGSCRIIEHIDEPRRFGFAYGTLPYHPELGEEAFLVHHRCDDTVEFEIVAFSRPASTLVRWSGPFGRWMQTRTTRRYLEGYRAHVME